MKRKSQFKMTQQTVVVLFICLQSLATFAAPMHPLLQPLHGTLQQQQLALQEQMLAIQQFQALQRYNAPPPIVINQQQPLLLLLPNTPSNHEPDEKYSKLNENLVKKNKPKRTEDDDSITIDAEETGHHQDNLIDRIDSKHPPMRAILLLPNSARFSIGEFISSLPFLPIEINVPDSISWIYNGISGIISGIGQSWPFNRPDTNENPVDMKSTWMDVRNRVMPIVVMPLGQAMPMQM